MRAISPMSECLAQIIGDHLNLIEKIDEQIFLGFTGRLNFFKSGAMEIQGAILFLEGKIVSVFYKNYRSRGALEKLIDNDLTNRGHKLALAPEAISREEIEDEIDFENFKAQFFATTAERQKSKNLRPPDHLKFLVAPEFLEGVGEVSLEEFQVLKAISEYAKVADLYEHSPLDEAGMTYALVELRKKGALKVIK